MLDIYLTFDGDAREAMEFYRSVFGGEFTALHSFGDAPSDMQVPDAYKDRIMHASLPVGETVLMASDHVPGCGPALAVGNNFAISIVGRSREHCDEVFAKLSAGGRVKMAMQETFWGAYFGNWTDRFGVNWMINYELPKA